MYSSGEGGCARAGCRGAYPSLTPTRVAAQGSVGRAPGGGGGARLREGVRRFPPTHAPPRGSSHTPRCLAVPHPLSARSLFASVTRRLVCASPRRPPPCRTSRPSKSPPRHSPSRSWPSGATAARCVARSSRADVTRTHRTAPCRLPPSRSPLRRIRWAVRRRPPSGLCLRAATHPLPPSSLSLSSLRSRRRGLPWPQHLHHDCRRRGPFAGHADFRETCGPHGYARRESPLFARCLAASRSSPSISHRCRRGAFRHLWSPLSLV